MKLSLIPILSLLCYGVVKSSASGAFEVWQQRYSHPTDAYDHLRRVACDSFGNIVAVGYTEGGPTGSDMLIIKYSGSGVIQWVRTYNGPGNNRDEGWDVALGNDGIAYVTGFSYSGSSSTSSDYATIAYSSNGEPLWTNRYNGTVGSEDFPAAILVSRGSNVIVTGRSASSAGLNYVTIAYSPAGLPLWTNSYDGTGQNDAASAIAEDNNGRIVVTGSSRGMGSGDDFATIGYSSGGAPLWTNRYSGPGLGADGATRLAIDESGNVYVTGTSYGGSTPGDDYATIAYSSSGTALWTNRYGFNTSDRSEAIAAYGDQIFVTGLAGNDYTTVSYSSSGLALWTNRYNGPGNSRDHPFVMAANTNGDVLITGISDGNGTSSDFATVAYSRTGTALWTNRYNGLEDSLDSAHGVAVDGNGNSIVVGNSGLANVEAVAIRYSLNGMPLWTNQFNGVADDDDWPQTITVDSAGNVFVAGSSETANNNTDYALIKYSSEGVPQWTNRYPGIGGVDIPQAITSDPSGRVFVAGSSRGNGTSEDYATVAYSNDGIPLWTNRYATSQPDIPSAIAVNVHGNVAVTGRSTGSFLTICYSPTGNTLWEKRYYAPVASDGAHDMVVVGQSNFVVTGTSAGDFVTIKYSDEGVGLWTNIYNGPATNADGAVAIAADASGNVFVAGYSVAGFSAGIGSTYDIVTIAYSSSGEALWTNRYNGPANVSDFPTDVAVGSNGMVFVTGYSYNNSSGTDPDYVTIAYLNSGEALWTNRYHGGVGEDVAYAIEVDKAHTVVVTGRSIRTGLINDIVARARHYGPIVTPARPAEIQNSKKRNHLWLLVQMVACM